MTAYEFGDILLLPFPFTDQTGVKKRPAVVVSSKAYNQSHSDVVVMAITTQDKPANVGEVFIVDWHKAGLLKTSVVKPVFTTIETSLVVRKLGKLESGDQKALKEILHMILG